MHGPPHLKYLQSDAHRKWMELRDRLLSSWLLKRPAEPWGSVNEFWLRSSQTTDLRWGLGLHRRCAGHTSRSAETLLGRHLYPRCAGERHAAVSRFFWKGTSSGCAPLVAVWWRRVALSGALGVSLQVTHSALCYELPSLSLQLTRCSDSVFYGQGEKAAGSAQNHPSCWRHSLQGPPST